MAITVKTITVFPLDGSTRDFNINFDYLARKFVQVAALGDGTRQELVLGTDYRFTTSTSIKTTVALGGAYNRIEIRRVTSATDRVVNFADGSILRANDLNASQVQAVHISEEARDAALLAIQQDDGGNLDARNRRIINLLDPVLSNDASTKGYTDGLHEKSLRVSRDIPEIRGQLVSALVGFDESGAPFGYPYSGTKVEELSAHLASPDGASLIGQFPTLESMRGYKFLTAGYQVFLREHTTGQGAGGGTWFVHKLQADSSDIDDNGCQIITNTGQVLRRKSIGNLYSDMFGLIAGGDFDTTIQNMFKASRTFRITDAFISHPGHGNGYKSIGGNVLDISDGLGFYVRGVGTGFNGPRIWHSGNNVCMRVKKNYATARDFWVSGGFLNLAIVGRGSDFSGDNFEVGAVALEASDMWGSQFHDLFITGYRNNSLGAAISLYNDTAWTEGANFKRVVIRSSVNGLWLHRNTSQGSTATDSFFSTSGDLEINAGVSGKATTYLKVGDGTRAGACFLYGHDIKITGWMSAGSFHSGVYVSDHSACLNGIFRFNWDGYGITPSSTTQVLRMIVLGGENAVFDCEVSNTSGQGDSYPVSMVNIVMNSLYGLNDSAFNGTMLMGRPAIHAKGAVLKFSGTLTQAECVSGISHAVSGLLPGMHIRANLSTWNANSKYQVTTTEWDIFVRGTDYPTIVRPSLHVADSLSVTTGTAVTSTSPAATGQFVNAVTLNQNYHLGSGAYGNTLSIGNGQANNATGYVVNSGRKFLINLPANPAATQGMPYKIELEVM